MERTKRKRKMRGLMLFLLQILKNWKSKKVIFCLFRNQRTEKIIE